MKRLKIVKKALALCCVLTLLTPAVGCKPASTKAEPQGKAYFSYFDTVSYVYSYAGDSAEAFETHSAEVSGILEEYHRLFDIYHEYSGMNNLCTVNRLAGGEAVPVDEKLISFLQYAVELHRLTDGEMNIMMGPVLSIWHDCRTEAEQDPSAARVPDGQALSDAAAHTALSALEIDAENLTVRLTDPEASIDVGALGKGYATERAAEYLAQQNASGYVLNIGGNLRIIGTKPDGTGWVTGIRNPSEPDGPYAARLELADTSGVTSGSYERYYTVDGVRYHHIIDQDTLMPADYFTSVTVICKDSGLADALSTALFCMSYEDGLELVDKLGDVEVLWILPDGTQRSTPGLPVLPAD